MQISQDESAVKVIKPALQMDFHDVGQTPVDDASKLHHLYFGQYLTMVLAIDQHF